MSDDTIGDLDARLAAYDGRGQRLIRSRLDAVQRRSPEWLWPGWLPLGKLAILGGRYGEGKSTLAAYLAATVSRGGLWPDGSQAPLGNVLMFVPEDDPEDTVAPRLDLCDADQTRIMVTSGVVGGYGQEGFFNLRKDLELLEEAIREDDIRLAIFDPLSSVLAGTDRNAEGDVRDLLQPIVRLARERRVCILGMMHTGKPSAGRRTPSERLLGSTGFPAMARTVILQGRVPDRHGDGPPRYVLGVDKSNVGMIPPPLEWTRDIDGPLVWLGRSSYTLDDLFSSDDRATSGQASPRATAEDFLLAALADGPQPAADLLALADSAGHSKATLNRAKDGLGIVSEKQRGIANGGWVWRIPDHRTPGPVETPALPAIAVLPGISAAGPEECPGCGAVTDGGLCPSCMADRWRA